MRVLLMLMTLLGGSVALSRQSPQENWKQCRSDDPERRIEGCSALIQSSQESDINLAEALYDRGLAYRHRGNYEDAIKDFDQALRLNPSFADAFYERGSAYSHLRNYVRAIQDYD